MNDKKEKPKRGKEFEVEDIVNDREVKIFNEQTKKYTIVNEYLIKWIGYEKKTWEPEVNLQNCKETLNEYLKRKRKIINLEENITEQLLNLKNLKQIKSSGIPYSKYGPSFKEVMNVKATVTEEEKQIARKQLLLNNEKMKNSFIYV